MSVGPKTLARRRLAYAEQTAQALEKAFSKRADLQLDVIESLWRLASDERVHERVRLSALGLLLVREEGEGSGAQVEVNITAGGEPSPARLQLASKIRAVLDSGQAPPAVPAAESVVDAVPEQAAVVEPRPANVIRPVFASTSRSASEAPPVLGLPEDT